MHVVFRGVLAAMTAWAGFWIMWGLIVLGLCLDNGLDSIAKRLSGASQKGDRE